MSEAYQNIIVDTRGSGPLRYGWITLNRPKALNALNDGLMDELGAALLAFDADDSIGAIVVTGSEKAFAAGADIAMMQPFDFPNAFRKGLISRNWDTLREVRKPVIAAVAGFALGGGCEVAMACDMIIAADNARFGQPEIKLGIIPGAGGTQRLPRALGVETALNMIVSGEPVKSEVLASLPGQKLIDQLVRDLLRMHDTPFRSCNTQNPGHPLFASLHARSSRSAQPGCPGRCCT